MKLKARRKVFLKFSNLSAQSSQNLVYVEYEEWINDWLKELAEEKKTTFFLTLWLSVGLIG